MKPFFAYLCCGFFMDSHLKNNPNDNKDLFENLPDGPKQDIIDSLDDPEKVSLSKTHRKYFYLDTRDDVFMKLPLKESKKPSALLCERLKTRKTLVIDTKNHYKKGILFKPKTLEMKYIKCLSGIQNLLFANFIAQYDVLTESSFKVPEFFPKLEKMEFVLFKKFHHGNIPISLKSLKINYFYKYHEIDLLKEKIAQMNQLEILTLDIPNISVGKYEV